MALIDLKKHPMKHSALTLRHKLGSTEFYQGRADVSKEVLEHFKDLGVEFTLVTDPNERMPQEPYDSTLAGRGGRPIVQMPALTGSPTKTPDLGEPTFAPGHAKPLEDGPQGLAKEEDFIATVTPGWEDDKVPEPEAEEEVKPKQPNRADRFGARHPEHKPKAKE
jgi:hypothetical protein